MQPANRLITSCVWGDDSAWYLACLATNLLPIPVLAIIPPDDPFWPVDMQTFAHGKVRLVWVLGMGMADKEGFGRGKSPQRTRLTAQTPKAEASPIRATGKGPPLVQCSCSATVSPGGETGSLKRYFKPSPSLSPSLIDRLGRTQKKRLHNGDTSRVFQKRDYEVTAGRLTTMEPDAQYLKGTRDRYLSLDRVLSRDSSGRAPHPLTESSFRDISPQVRNTLVSPRLFECDCLVQRLLLRRPQL